MNQFISLKGYTKLSLLSIIFLISSCSKYEEGPVISLRSKKERVANTWIIDKATDNGNDVTSSYDEYTLSLDKDGDAQLVANYRLGSLTFVYDTDGTWKFSGNKESLILDMENDDADNTYQILKLKEEELWLREEGSDLELELKPR